jgi:3-hydroxyacyl-[acyl-carrier-protein] dehydratase
MHYVFVDRILSLTPGHSLRAYKNVTASEDPIRRYAPGVFVLSAPMVLEAMAQAAGLLVAASSPATAQPVLAKVQPFTAYGLVRPGDRLDLDVQLDAMRQEGGRARVQASIDGRTVADAVIYLALLPLEQHGAASEAARLRGTLADLFPDWFDQTGLRKLAR